MHSHTRNRPPTSCPPAAPGEMGRGPADISSKASPLTNRARRAPPLGTLHLDIERCMRLCSPLRSSRTRGFDRHGQITSLGRWVRGSVRFESAGVDTAQPAVRPRASSFSTPQTPPFVNRALRSYRAFREESTGRRPCGTAVLTTSAACRSSFGSFEEGQYVSSQARL